MNSAKLNFEFYSNLCHHKKNYFSVVKHLVNSDFWLNYNADDPIIYGNMTQTKDGKIAYDNFMEKIDTGMPEATDSGNDFFFHFLNFPSI